MEKMMRSLIFGFAMKEDGFRVEGVMTVFNFTWSGGKNRLETRGLWVDSLLDLNLRQRANAT